MGIRGRNPIPKEILALRGEGVKSPLGAAAAWSAVFDEKPPDFLSDAGLEHWYRMVGELSGAGVLRAVDRAALGSYCAAYGDLATLSRYEAENADTLELVDKIRIMGAKRAAQRVMASLGSEFGLSPASRIRFAGALTPADEEDDGLLDG